MVWHEARSWARCRTQIRDDAPAPKWIERGGPLGLMGYGEMATPWWALVVFIIAVGLENPIRLDNTGLAARHKTS